MITVREVIAALEQMDGNTPVMSPAVVGYDPADRVHIRSVCFRGSFQEPGQWIDENYADDVTKKNGVIKVVVIE